jgi:2-polyprenyl-6-methoxyphenol hydroxylase-like FAD-dependent oxidoreductase
VKVPDVLVVGGGPAGSTVAGLLARRGWDVTLLDRARFPRPKACGECINPGGVELLRRLGLERVVRGLDPVPLLGWDVHTDGGRRAEGRFGPEVGPAWAVPRSRLDAALLTEARSRGVTVREGLRVAEAREGTPTEWPSVAVSEPGGATGWWRARMVIGADGLRSVTARALGRPRAPDRTRKLSLTLRLRGSGPADDRGRLVLTSAGTLGLAPVGRDLWNATVVVSAPGMGRRVAADPLAFALSFVRARIPDWDSPPVVEGGPWGSGNFDFRVRRVVGHGMLLVGDAAGYYDPLTGQGIQRALRSAELAAGAVDTALREGRVSERDLAPYARDVRRSFMPGRALQRVVEAVVSRRATREQAIGRLGAAPRSMDTLVRVTGDARPAASLLHPRIWSQFVFPPSQQARRPGAACER